MAARGRRAQISPGPWSLAVARKIAELVDARPGRRKQFALDAGFSGRLAQLLNGDRAWYLEDVERACRTLDLDVVEFLDSLNVDTAPPLRLVADSDDTYGIEDVDAAYDGGA
jgi:hypothetical protein